MVDDDTEATEPSTDDDFSVDSIDMLDDLYAEATKGYIYLDDIMVSTAHASKPKGIDASHLSKIWRIDPKLCKANPVGHVLAQNKKR